MEMEKTREYINKANIFFETLSENIVTREEKLDWFNVSACLHLECKLYINGIFVGIDASF